MLLLGGAAIFVSNQGAYAQEDQNAIVLDAVTVEAQSNEILKQEGYVAKQDRIGTKTDTPIAKIPQAISTVTQKQIEDQEPRTLNEALSYTASANPNSFGYDTRNDAFFLRGFPAYYNGMFRDGLRQYNAPTAMFKTEPYGLEGITILKGPASSLYGVSGPGGIVNLVTKRPKEETFREVEVLLGENNRYQTGFDFSGKANEDGTLLYRLTGLGRDSDTFLEGYSDDKLYIAPALTFKPDEDTKLTILGELSRTKTGGTAFFYNPAPGEVSDLYEGDPAYNDYTQGQGRIGYEFEHRFNDLLTVRQNLRYSKADADLEYSGHYPVGADLARYWGHYKENVATFTVDNMAQFTFDTGPVSHVAIAGIDYTYADYDSAGAVSYVSADDIKNMPLAFAGSQKMSNVGVYAQDQLTWDALTLFGSARYDWVDTKAVNTSEVETSQKDGHFSGRIGLSYETPWGLIPYLNYSSSFAPNIGFVSAEGTNIRSAAKPTAAEQKEIGVKYQIPDTNLLISAALFDIKQKDGVVYDGTFDEDGQQRQRQLDLHSRGIELEANASFDNGFGLIASYTHLKMTIDKGLADTEGKELSATPNDIFSLWGNYQFNDGQLAGLGLGAGVRYVGESFGNDQNTIDNEDRVFVDAALSYDFGKRFDNLEGVKLQINAKNLFDERKVICSAGNCYRDEGRSIMGSLRYRF
ncbi:TonB-dependent siderophore receptor [Mesorhizobium sp. CGMCC 1.15528]|uniref:TonB-dependent siderophore receptor n=1 Tax=Mesorhizobium zhangyense TaxID=1776730 RepID=A0A7C9R5M3_9HYPH|nr:TonB-dependent siderophore receptor [Mesorhizobium zhangyense]NGN40654.1 TonB-dependent siderophore receptor [Mesorhizobium zhangyense]